MVSGPLRTIVRDNASDARVLADLEQLAAVYGTVAAPAAEPEITDPAVSDVELLAEAYGTEPVESRSVPSPAVVAAHVRRNRTVYGVAAALLAVLTLVEPVAQVTAPGDAETAAFGTPAPPGAAAATAGELPGPGGAVATPPVFDAIFPADPATFAASPSFEASTLPPIPPSFVELLEPLRIVDSGYASTTGGTPLEQPPPGDGLPVTAVGPHAARYSFIRLAGTAPVLTLSLVTEPGSSLNEGSAAVSACRITDPGWTGKRGVPTSEAPAYDANDCVKGAADEGGMWNFDLSARTDRTDPNGFALVPSPDAGAPFQVVFNPVAS